MTLKNLKFLKIFLIGMICNYNDDSVYTLVDRNTNETDNIKINFLASNINSNMNFT